MQGRFGALIVALSVVVVACSSGHKKHDDQAAAAPGAAANATPAATNNEPLVQKQTAGGREPAAGSSTSLGLAEGCTYRAKDATHGCFVCTPRELPLVRCVAVDAGFDPAKNCNYDNDRMTCAAAKSTPFTFDLATPDRLESLYEQLPLLVIGAKLLIGSKLSQDPKVKALFDGLLDAFEAHRKEIFTQGDIAPFLKQTSVLVKKADPNIPEAELALAHAAITAAVKTAWTAMQNGLFQESQLVKLLDTALGALPKGLTGGLLPGLDALGIKSQLEGGDSSSEGDLLSSILGGAGGGSLDALLAGLAKANSGTATSSGTSTGTGTGTGTEASTTPK